INALNNELPSYASTASGGFGGGIFAPASSNALVVIQNSVIAQNMSGIRACCGSSLFNPFCCGSITNFAPGPDLAGTFTSNGQNLIGIGNGSGGFTNAVGVDLVGSANAPIDPLLGPLQDNGGLTRTHALLPGSPALDAGHSGGLSTDQRGGARIV